jgi:hypothetical protein
METVAIAIIGTVVFGVVTTLAAFIRQLLLSRDLRLNDKAQQRALKIEAAELKKLRTQMEGSKRFDSHYKMIDSNKEDIQYLDQKIDEILNKKFALIQKYSDMTAKESTCSINSEKLAERKSICNMLRREIDREMAFYDKQLEQLQESRGTFMDSHKELRDYLLEQEKSRNNKLDDIYHKHSGLLEKIYIRLNDNSERLAIKSIDSGMQSYKLLTDALKILLQFFHISSNITPERANDEILSRINVSNAESDINDNDYNDTDDHISNNSKDTDSEHDLSEELHLAEP